MPHTRFARALLLAAALGSCATGAAFSSTAMAQTTATEPVKLHGVTYAPTVQSQGQTLELNGAGTRYKAVFKVYTAGLYLEKPARSFQEVTALGGPKRISVTMLRDIDSAELGKLFARGMEDNMDRATFSKLIPGVMRMSDVFTQHKKLLKGESFTVDWIPAQGAIVSVKGQPQGEAFKEPEFFNALLGIWLGPKPADALLKKSLLGEKENGL